MNLRPYQQDAVDGIAEAFKAARSTLVVMPTGTGKTIVFGHVAADMIQHGRVMVIAHREELIYQAADKIHRITGQDVDIEKAERRADGGGLWRKPVVVASVQTLDRRGKRFDPSQFSCVIVDEAHHAPAASYRRVLDHFGRSKILGVTATPDRADEAALGQVFESVAYEYGVVNAINDGWLVPIEQQFVHVDGLDFSACRTTAGDLNGADLAAIMEYEQTMHEVTGATMEIVGDRKTLVFAVSVAQAERMSEILNRHNPGCSAFVCGKTPKDDRSDIFNRYREGGYQYLVNVGIATEGFDCPDVACVAMARPTKSRALFCQMLGRGTRPLDGLVDQFCTPELRKGAIQASNKKSMLVLDFVGNSGRHKLITAADILGGDYTDEIVQAAVREMQTGDGKPDDIAEELAKAEIKLRKEREAAEAARRAKVKAKASFSTQKVNPFNVFDITERREPEYLKGRQLTPKMVKVLEQQKVPLDGLTYAQASQIIGEFMRRRDAGLCSYRQAKFLQRHGFDTETMTKGRAMQLFMAIKNNRWKCPKNLKPRKELVA